jgi:hypothetical protein
MAAILVGTVPNSAESVEHVQELPGQGNPTVQHPLAPIHPISHGTTNLVVRPPFHQKETLVLSKTFNNPFDLTPGNF